MLSFLCIHEGVREVIGRYLKRRVSGVPKNKMGCLESNHILLWVICLFIYFYNSMIIMASETHLIGEDWKLLSLLSPSKVIVGINCS